MKTKREKQNRRHKRVRASIKGSADRPRLSVFRSNKHVWVQLIDDEKGSTIAAMSDKDIPRSSKDNKARRTLIAVLVGEEIAAQALQKEIRAIVFDRGGYRYHGIIKALAEGARKGGLKF